MIYTQPLSVEQLNDLHQVEAWCQQLNTLLAEEDRSASQQHRILVTKDNERQQFLPTVEVVSHGVTSEYPLSRDFFDSGEYRIIVELGQKLQGLIEPGAYFQRGERKKEVASFGEALDWLMSESKRGYSIQRYKGLGEMNPAQLWETTMNPDTRRMLKVTIEDAIAADLMFTTLMGDQVEPRRNFIETNALAVTNLDV